jgi:hypothetical protein
MCQLAETSGSAIAIAFLVLNLEEWLSAFPFYLISLLNNALMGQLDATGAQNRTFFFTYSLLGMTVNRQNLAASHETTRP